MSHKNTTVKIFTLFVLVPLISFSSLDLAIVHNYWDVLKIQLPTTSTPTHENSCQSFNSLAPCVHEGGTVPGGINNILVGDSHADSLSSVYTQVASSRSDSYAVWTKGNCPFILQETIKDAKYNEVLASLSTVSSGVSCLQHNQQIVDYARSRSPIRVWVTNRNSQGYRSTFSWNISSETLRNLIEINLQKLSSISLKVIYVGPVPEKVYGDVPTHRLIWQLQRG